MPQENDSSKSPRKPNDPLSRSVLFRLERAVTEFLKGVFSLERTANGAQWVSAVCSVFVAVSAVVAVVAFIHSVRAEQIKAAEDSIARLYPMDNSFEAMIASTDVEVNLHGLFWQDSDGELFHELQKTCNAKWRQKFKAACGLKGNMFEFYLLIRGNLEGHPNGKEITDAWDNYFRMTCENSYGFRSYIYDTPQVWTKSLMTAIDSYTKGLPHEQSTIWLYDGPCDEDTSCKADPRNRLYFPMNRDENKKGRNSDRVLPPGKNRDQKNQRTGTDSLH